MVVVVAPPPILEAPLAANGQLTQAWAGHLQDITDALAAAPAAALLGVTTGADATAGQIGEYITAASVVGGGVALAPDAGANVTTISLTAGDWDVWGSVHFQAAAGTTRTYVIAACSLASGGVSGMPTGGGVGEYQGASTSEVGTYPFTMARFSSAATTTVYLVAQAGFTGSMTASGFIAARRAR